MTQPSQKAATEDPARTQLYTQLGAVGGMHDQVLAEMKQLAGQLHERDQQLVKARLHAETSDDHEALAEIDQEAAQLAEAWQVLREHLGDDLDDLGAPESDQESDSRARRDG